MPDDLPPSDDSTPASDGPPEPDGSSTPPSSSAEPPAWTNLPDPSDETAQHPRGGRYQPISFHKRGGMGQVWRAKDTELDREVAFKVIRPQYADDETTRRRFVFEAEVTGRLAHPAVIPVYGFGRDDVGRPYYAMRFVEGQSLQEAIAAFHAPDGLRGAERVVALRRLLGHFVTVCRSVDYAHSRGVIHRDLKPGNVMVGAYGETLVVDWGIAKRLRAGAGEPDAAPAAAAEEDATPTDPTRSLRGSRLGSPGFWSPEQAKGRPELHDERTDVYGLGTVLFAILTGTSPHPSGKHEDEPPSARAMCPWVDAGIDQIARTAMAVAPADRYQSAAALALAVEKWLADQPVAAQRAAVAALILATQQHPNDFALAEELARQRSNLGLMLAGMGRDADAVVEFLTSATDFARLARARNKPRLFAEQANSLIALARSYDALSQAADADAARREAARLYQRLIATQPEEYKGNYGELMLTWTGSPPSEVAEPQPAFDQTAFGMSEVPATPTPPPVPQPERLAEETQPLTPPDLSELGKTEVREPPRPAPTAASDDTDDPKTLLPDVPEGWRERVGEEQLNLTGGYTLLGELARGGMGVLYLARDNALHRQVVIKALHERTAADQYGRARFLQEMQVTASLEHPNIVRLYTHGVRGDGTPFMVMEHLNGVILLRLLTMHGPGWTADFLDPLAQACDGLHYAHLRGIIHRDAKLSNIVVTPTGRAVVLDWGIAKVIGQPETAHGDGTGEESMDIRDLMLTHEGAIVGTAAYMAPEQARGEANAIGPWTDVFTLGANLFHIVSGRPPGWGGNAVDVVARLIHGDIPRLRDVRPDAPPQLDAICARAMAFRPEDRYPTAVAVAAELRAFLATRSA